MIKIQLRKKSLSPVRYLDAVDLEGLAGNLLLKCRGLALLRGHLM